MKNSVYKGLKYYTYNENHELVVLRLKRIKNDNLYIMLDKDNNEIRLNREEFGKYIKLNQDGFVTFSRVALEQGIEDVIVSLHRKEDLSSTNTPYAVCRQNIFDIFTNQINRDENMMYVGVSVSKDTCPVDVDYNITLACNGVLESDIVNIYLDDSLEDIMRFVNPVNYDSVLRRLYDDIGNSKTVSGYCKSLEELLIENDFMQDFHRAFKVIELKSVIKDNNINIEQLYMLWDILKSKISNVFTIPYGKDIDLTKIERDYSLVCDNSNKVYILAYDKGEYVNPSYAKLEDKRDAKAMLDVIKN